MKERKGPKGWLRSHPGLPCGFWAVWCVYWEWVNVGLARSEMRLMATSGGTAAEILWSTWDMGVVAAYLALLRLNCVWYQQARRKSSGG